MRETLQKKCDNYIKNRDIMKNTYKWDNQYIIAVCASFLGGKNIVVSEEKLKHCKEIIDKNTGVFSNFRGNVKLPIISMLAASENPEQKFEDAMKIYEFLKEHFRGTEYLTLVSTILTDMISVSEAEGYATRGKRIYDLMKKEHPFLTSGEDSVFAVLMAFSDKTDAELIEDMESCYKAMKKEFSDGNSVQALSHVLSLVNGTSDEKCEKVLNLYQGIKDSGKKYGKHYELAVLGSLSMLCTDTKAMVEDISNVDEFLSSQKGYGVLGIDKTARLMHAAMITADDFSDESQTNTTAITGTLAMVAAQQAAMCAIIASTAATTAATAN